MVQTLYFVSYQPVLCGFGASCYKMEGLDSKPPVCTNPVRSVGGWRVLVIFYFFRGISVFAGFWIPVARRAFWQFQGASEGVFQGISQFVYVGGVFTNFLGFHISLLAFSSLKNSEDFWVFLSFLSDRSVFCTLWQNVLKRMRSLGKERKKPRNPH